MWIVISVTSDSLSASASWSETSEISCRNDGQRRLLPLGAELARDADELLEVLDPAARLDRALGLERLERAAAGEHRLDELVHLELLRRRLEREHRRVEAAHGLDRGGAEAGSLGIGHRLEEADARSRRRA